MHRRTFSLLLVGAVSALSACRDAELTSTAPGTPALDRGGVPASGAVFTSTNAANGNVILSYARAADGTLRAEGSFATGGTGTGSGLGSQGAVTLSSDGRVLLAVNAGSHQLSAFSVRGTSLTLLNTVASGGTTPISVTEHGGLVYVLNAGGSGNIAGFRVDAAYGLTVVAGSTRPLSSAASGPAQVSFSTDGSTLVVTEKATNRIVSYHVDSDGLAGAPTTLPSSGMTPFGFAFTLRNVLVVSEAFGGAPGASAASSYQVTDDASSPLELRSASVANTQGASCWTAITPNGRFAYVANTGSGTVSGYAIAPNGTLRLLAANGITAYTGAGTSPADEAISQNGQYLYVRSGGVNTVRVFAIAADGSLDALQTVNGFPAGYQGLAAR